MQMNIINISFGLHVFVKETAELRVGRGDGCHPARETKDSRFFGNHNSDRSAKRHAYGTMEDQIRRVNAKK